MNKPKTERDKNLQTLDKKYNVIKKLLTRGTPVVRIAKTLSVNRHILRDYIFSHVELDQLKYIKVSGEAFCCAIRDIQEEIYSEAKLSQTQIRMFLVKDYWPSAYQMK